MKKIRTKILSLVISMALLLTIIPINSVSASVQINYDEILINAGMPKSLIDSYDEEVKMRMANQVKERAGEFVSAEYSYFNETENGLEEVSIKARGIIPDSDLTLGYTTWKWNNNLYGVWGTYNWNRRAYGCSNDIFSLTVNGNFKIVGSSTRYSTYLRSDSSRSWTTQTSESKSTYDISESPAGAAWSSLGTSYGAPMFFKGSCNFDMIPTSSSRTGSIKLQYGYNSGSGSFGGSFSGFGFSFSGGSGVMQTSKLYQNINF